MPNGHNSEWWCRVDGRHSEEGAQLFEVTVTWKPVYATGHPKAPLAPKSIRACENVDCSADFLERVAQELRSMKART